MPAPGAGGRGVGSTEPPGSGGGGLPAPGAGMSPVPAAVLLASLSAAALLAERWQSVAAIAVVLLVAAMRAPASRRLLYLYGTLGTALTVFLLTPFVETEGFHVLWGGPTIPVLGTLDVTTEELANGAFQALRLAAVGLASAVYALRLDHDRLLRSARVARQVAARRRARAPDRPDARARRRRPRRVAARPRRRRRGRPRPCGARSARCSQARSSAGSTWRRRWRPAATADPVDGLPSPRWAARDTAPSPPQSRSSSWGRCGSSDARSACPFTYPGAAAPALETSRSCRERAMSARSSARRAREVDAAARLRRARAALPRRAVRGTGRRSRAATRAARVPPSSPGRSRASSRIPRIRSC